LRTYPTGHDNAGVAAVIFLLDDWLQAMENGTAHHRLPDPNYVRSNGKPTWTEDELDTLIRDLDAEIDQEVTRLPGTSVGAKAGPGFSRLALPQRLALAQQLDNLVQRHQEALQAFEPRSDVTAIGAG